MNKKNVTFYVLISLVAIATIVLACSVFPLNAKAADYMRLSKENRIEYAQKRYEEFTNNPDKKFEVLISLKEVPYTEISALLSGQGDIISAFHCFEANGECAVGGYTECEGKNAEKVIEDYYANIYNLVAGQVEGYDDYIESLKQSYGYDEEASKEPNIALETALKDAEHSLAQFVLQKEAMDRGEFYIYGVRLVMTGAEIDKLIASDVVALVEILDFDNDDLLTPIK